MEDSTVLMFLYRPSAHRWKDHCKSVTHGQCNDRPMITTFWATSIIVKCQLTSIKLYCKVTGHNFIVWTTSPELLITKPVPQSQTWNPFFASLTHPVVSPRHCKPDVHPQCIKNAVYPKRTTTTVLRSIVWNYPGEQEPQETFTQSIHADHQPSFISFLHVLQSIASSLFIYVLDSLLAHLPPIALWSTSWSGTSTSYSIHFFTQSLSSFCNTCP